MLSRIFWIGVAGLAMIAGMAMQDSIFSWGDDRARVSLASDRDVEARVDRAIDRSFDHMEVVDSDGDQIDVPAETKRALAEAVGRLVKAETELAMLRITDEGEQETRAAQALRDQARADVDRLKAQIESLERSPVEQEAVRDQVRQEVREEVRTAVREAVRN